MLLNNISASLKQIPTQDKRLATKREYLWVQVESSQMIGW